MLVTSGDTLKRIQINFFGNIILESLKKYIHQKALKEGVICDFSDLKRNLFVLFVDLHYGKLWSRMLRKIKNGQFDMVKNDQFD